MAFNTNQTIVAEYYIAALGRLPDQEGFDFWTGQLDAGMNSDDLMGYFLDRNFPEVATRFPEGQTNEEFIASVYTNTFGRDADAEGLAFWTAKLDTLSQTEVLAEMLAIAKDPANTVDAAHLAEQQVLAEAALDDSTTPTVPEVEGSTYELTSGTDKGADFTGTDDADTFDASIVQNAFTGGVSNSLSSADKLNGGAGTDTLNAQIVAEFVGATTGYNIDIQPQTTSIENVTFEARDSIDANNTTVTVDAKDMTAVQKIGSLQSDGDLIIENLTTLTDSGDFADARNTDSLTITMDHTDNFNSDDDASDLTVYLDEDYLLAGKSTAGASLKINFINTLNLELNDANKSDIEGFASLNFYVGEAVEANLVSVNVDGLELSEVQAAIEAALQAAGHTTVTVEPYIEQAYFGTNIYYENTNTVQYNAGDYVGPYTAFVLSNSGSEDLNEGGYLLEDGQKDGSLAYSQSNLPSNTTDNEVSINVELEKVGREGEGGNLKIGGKSLDEDEGNGIHTFDITVKGDESKLSNLGQITSTNDALKVVNIASETRTDNNYASLTVRGEDTDETGATPFGGTLETLNASAFKGDLRIGIETAAKNIDTFTATGGGDITLNAEYDGSALASDAQSFTITTGIGSDEITASVNGTSTSTSTDTDLTVTSNGGDNTITLSSTNAEDNEATVTTGNGSDEVTGGGTHLTVDTNGGDDAIYVENTGTKAIVTLAKDAFSGAADADVTVLSGNNVLDNSLLYGQTVQVTLAAPSGSTAAAFVDGFEATADIVASNGYLTTQADFYNAIASAINNDDVLNELAEASVDSAGKLTITYLVDGSTLNGDALVEVKLLNDWDDLNGTEQAGIVSALEEEYNDSAIDDTMTETAYNQAQVSITDTIDVVGADQKAVYTLDLTSIVLNTTGGADTLIIDGVTAYTALADATSAATIATAINGGTITLSDGVVYDIDATNPAAVSLTAQTFETNPVANLVIAAGDNSTAGATQPADTALTQTIAGTVSNGTIGTNSTTEGANTVNAGTGSDVIVLSTNTTDATQKDTVVFDDSAIGDNVVVNFDTNDVLDFTDWLTNVQYATGSTSTVSQSHIAGTLTTAEGSIINNSVLVTDMTFIADSSAGTALDFDTMTDTQVLAEINAGTFGIGANSATLVGDDVKAIIMIEDEANATATDDNDGFFKVYEVTYDITDGEFTKASLVGTVDFGEDTVIDTIGSANIA